MATNARHMVQLTRLLERARMPFFCAHEHLVSVFPFCASCLNKTSPTPHANYFMGPFLFSGWE